MKKKNLRPQPAKPVIRLDPTTTLQEESPYSGEGTATPSKRWVHHTHTTVPQPTVKPGYGHSFYMNSQIYWHRNRANILRHLRALNSHP